jgi:hypothetical protein
VREDNDAMIKRLGFGAAPLVAMLACSGPGSSAVSVASPPDPSPESTVITSGETSPPADPEQGIVKIQARDVSVTLLSSSDGVRRLTVQDEHGRVIARGVDLETLRTLDARAYDLVESSVSGKARADIQGYSAR